MVNLASTSRKGIFMFTSTSIMNVMLGCRLLICSRNSPSSSFHERRCHLHIFFIYLVGAQWL